MADGATNGLIYYMRQTIRKHGYAEKMFEFFHRDIIRMADENNS